MFRAIRDGDKRAVALKVLPWLGDPALRRQALREIEIMKRFRHPRILHLDAHGELPDGGGLWLELELCDGSVSGTVAYAWRNRWPRAASALNAGVSAPAASGRRETVQVLFPPQE